MEAVADSLLFTCYRFGQKPYAFVSLQSSVVVQQSYDIRVELDLPRSPPNLEAGNFMIDMKLLSTAFSLVVPEVTFTSRIIDYIPENTVLFTSSRPAILTYQSTLVRLSKQVAGMPWYLLGWRREAEKLDIIMAEGVRFPRGSRNVPETIFLELQTRGSGDKEIEVYNAKIKLRARFSGLRWLMYNHRIFSFVVFTGAFWGAEVVFSVLAWVMLSSLGSNETGQAKFKNELKGEETDGSTAIKTEEKEEDIDEIEDADLSDTPRNFPTYGRQPPLYYAPKVKSEIDASEQILDHTAIQPLAAAVEADDESEEVFGRSRYDSGIGTSFSESPRSSGAGVQRRRSKGGS